jgi:alkylhydroperoxidase/carboxymuconolactone decarboxylase family protein YurZ
MSIHSCSLGAPILLEEAESAGKQSARRSRGNEATPACDQMRAAGQWNDAWNPFFELDPSWTGMFMEAGVSIYACGVLTPKVIELISVAFDASYTHMFAPGTRRHIRAALAQGASVEEVFEVLKICVAEGVQACNLAVPILLEELERLEEPSVAGPPEHHAPL